MQRVLLKSGKLVEVSNNEAHRLIDQEGAKLVTDAEKVRGYRNKMMSTSTAKTKPAKTSKKVKHGTKSKRTNNSR